MGLDVSVGAEGLVALLAFVAPGFLVLYLVASSRGRRLGGNPFLLAMGSLLVSGFLGLLFLAWNGLERAEDVVAFVLRHPLRTTAQFLALAVAASLVAVLYEAFDPLGRLVRRATARRTGRDLRPKNVWDAYLGDNLDAPVLVEGNDGRLVGGFLRRHSESEEGEPNALVLAKPALVTRDAQGALAGVELGRSMLLQARDVRTVTVLDGPLADGRPPAPA